jgi:hypothetical protein
MWTKQEKRHMLAPGIKEAFVSISFVKINPSTSQMVKPLSSTQSAISQFMTSILTRIHSILSNI